MNKPKDVRLWSAKDHLDFAQEILNVVHSTDFTTAHQAMYQLALINTHIELANMKGKK
jgi:hypothetical protein